MFSTTLFRHNAPLTARCPAIYRLSTKVIARKSFASPQWLLPVFKRCQSTAARTASRPAQTYPELVNIYLAPSAVTAYNGVVRVIAVCAFLSGTLWVAPPYFWDVDKPTWVGPAVVLGATGLFVSAVAFGHGTITSIRVHLPKSARSSKENLMRFANNTPPTTRLKVQFFRAVPWLLTREMYFSELRRLPQTRWRILNLEYVAADELERMAQLSGWQRRITKRYFCQYWANMTLKDRSAVRGVWEKMWEQIPVAGKDHKGAVVPAGERKPTVMRNRMPSAQSAPPARPSSERRIRR